MHPKKSLLPGWCCCQSREWYWCHLCSFPQPLLSRNNLRGWCLHWHWHSSTSTACRRCHWSLWRRSGIHSTLAPGDKWRRMTCTRLSSRPSMTHVSRSALMSLEWCCRRTCVNSQACIWMNCTHRFTHIHWWKAATEYNTLDAGCCFVLLTKEKERTRNLSKQFCCTLNCEIGDCSKWTSCCMEKKIFKLFGYCFIPASKIAADRSLSLTSIYQWST